MKALGQRCRTWGKEEKKGPKCGDILLIDVGILHGLQPTLKQQEKCFLLLSCQGLDGCSHGGINGLLSECWTGR